MHNITEHKCVIMSLYEVVLGHMTVNMSQNKAVLGHMLYIFNVFIYVIFVIIIKHNLYCFDIAYLASKYYKMTD